MPVRITSRQNGRVKNVVKLSQRRYRDAQQRAVVEGVREVARALHQQIIPYEAFVCPDLLPAEAAGAIERLQSLSQSASIELFEVTPPVFAKMAYRRDSGGLLIVIPYLTRSLSDLCPARPALLAVIEGAEKPGNLGAVLRAADGAGADAVIVSQSGAGTDLHNPNVVRASLGTLFSVPVAAAPSEEIIGWLRGQGVRILATTPAATKRYTAVDMTRPIAVVAGSEAHGLQQQWLDEADERVIIPMYGIADSLNLATSISIMLYEAVRQRHQQPGMLR